MVTKEEIKAALFGLGVRPGDSAIVHSSLKAFGQVENGPDTVIDALLESIGPEGTLVLPTFTLSFGELGKVVFDMTNSKSEVGIITEVFRKRPGVIRSTHLIHSVGAYGKRATEALGDGIHPFGKGSSFEFLLNVDAWNLFLGAGMQTCTALHMAEELGKVSYRFYKEYPGSFVIYPDGKKVPSNSKSFIKQPGLINDFEKIESIYRDEGILNYAKAGTAKLIASKMSDIYRVTKKRLAQDPFFLVRKEGTAV